MKIELRNHPAQARHPVNNRPLVDQQGNPVPLILDQHGIYLEDVLLGYCGKEPDRPISLIVPVDETVRDEVFAHVEKHVGTPRNIAQPPKLVVDNDGVPVSLDALNGPEPTEEVDEYDD